MTREPVSSNAVVSIGYDEDTNTLEVEYRHGHVYQYAHVSPDEHEALINAPSIGRALQTLRARGQRVT